MRKIRLMWAVTAAIGACVLLLTLVSNVSADPPDKVTLAVSPSSITANGLTTTTITATVTDQGTPSDGVTVTFTTTLGIFANWERTITVTTTQGVAVTWLRSVPASGTLTSTVGANAAGTAFTSTQVLFTANPCQSDLTAWTEYAANPIFGQGVDGNTLRAYYPSVLYDESRFGGHGDARHYKMWYGTRMGSDYGTGYAVSDDGIHWVTVTVPVTNINGYHAHVLYDSDRFGGDVDEPYYKMWYWDDSGSSYINYATSGDGVDWTDYAGNPVITNALGWGSAPVYDASVIYNSSGDPAQYEAWIDNNGRFYYITSTNGITWTGNNRELLADREDWELSTYSRASVLKADGAYHMWYGGADAGGGNHGIGYAVSTDGQHWIKSVDNPIFHKDDGPVWRDQRSYTPRVLYSATRFDGHGSPEQYKMWFSGRDAGAGNYTVGHATLNPTILSLDDTSGSGQSGAVGSALSQPFVVGLRDSCGNPASGVSVTFVISGSPAGAVGQSLAVLAGTTGVSGQSATTLTFGSKPGVYTMTAQATGVSGMPAVLTGTATPGPVHHFSFATVGDQVERYAFTVTVTAEDAFSNTVIAYTAPVALTDTTSTIDPALSGCFVGGVLTQAVTINAEGTDVVITATHTTTPTILGSSNSFDVIPVRVVNLNTGEWFVTIQDAIDDADTLSGAGHVISVTAGIYNENVSITKNDITLTGVGAGANPAHHTIIDGLAPTDIGGSPGINLPSGVTGVTIRDLRVQDFHNSSGINTGARNDNFVVSNTHVYSNAINLGFANGGIYMRGPVTNVLVTGSEFQYNRGRGFVIWNGFKQHITVTNNVVRYNNCCGIELQDGTASGVLIAGNIVEGNADNGIGLVGLTSGGGTNRVFSNTLRDNGRFGIEIKLPDGTGLESGDGSIVVEENRVEHTFIPADVRDLVGIAAFRRSWVPGNGNVDIPTGVVIKENYVHGFVQTTTSDGFGIVVEGTNMAVLSNAVTGNDVGIQVQAGHQPYVPNTGTNGDQDNLADEYFGRGNSPVGEGWLDSNTVVSNGVGIRVVNGALTATNNTISGSTSAGVVLTGTGTVTVTLGGDPSRANAFRENGSGGVTHVTVTLPYTNPAIYAYYNDWDAVALADIEDSIYHWADDPSLAEVVYSDLTLSDDGGNPMADGVSSALVTATLAGLLQPAGHVVSCTTDLGTLGIVTGTTDSDGIVTTTITSLSEDTATITGTTGIGGDNPRSDTTSVTFAPLSLDHFHVYLVQDQLAGVGFPVAISARDAGDLILTGFNGQATLADTTGTLVPGGPIEFQNGVWNGIVTITRAYAGNVVTAAYVHDVDKKGASNAFDVNHNVATSVALSPAATVVAAGQSVTYTAWATDAHGNGWDATSTAYYAIGREAGGAWADNVYTAQYSGTWTITTVNGVDDSALLVVTRGPATGITLAPATYTATAGDAVVYTVTADDEYGNTWDVTAAATYTATLGAGGAWADHVYTSQFAGTWTVSTTWNSLTGTATLHVITATVAEIRLAPASASITAGQPVTYAVVATDTSGNRWDATVGTYFVIDGGAKGGWAGHVYGSESAGIWTVTAFYGGEADTAVLTVTHAIASGIELGPAVYTATAGNPVAYAVWASDAYGNDWDATAEAGYAIENDAGGGWVGNVYSTQLAGTWAVTATWSGLTDTAMLQVVQATVVEVGLSPASATITAGHSVAYTVIATDTSGNRWDATADAHFVVDSGARGAWAGNVYTSEASGNWNVTAVTNGQSDSAVLTVVYDAAIGITLSPQAYTTTADAAVAYTVQAVDALGNDWDATARAGYTIAGGAGGTWAGSVYTPELVGTWTVTATLDGQSDNGVLVVAHGRTAAVMLSPASAIITAGESITYTAWAMDAPGNGWDATANAIYAIEGGAGGSWADSVYTSQSAGTWVVSATVDSAYGTALLTVTLSQVNIPGVNVMPTTVDVEEGGITATYSLRLNSEPTASVTITVATDGQVSVEPVSVTFNALNWDTAQQVIVAAVDDADVEGVHASTISHSAASADSNYDGIAIVDTVAHITDNDVSPAPTLVQFSSATYSVKETADLANITVTLNMTSAVPVTVTYATDDGTATDGYDYAAVDGTLRFGIGQIARTFAVPILGDTVLEGDETVRLVLSSPIHAALGAPSEAVLTIVDNVLFMPCTMRDSGE